MGSVAPPDEARSLMLQVTTGCSHNGCRFCDLYRNRDFSTTSFEHIERALQSLGRVAGCVQRVFLAEGDALCLPMEQLERILVAIRQYLPHAPLVATYGDTRSLLDKSQADLETLRRLGLTLVYHGLESGFDPLLLRMNKGGTRDEAIEMSRRLRAADIRHTVLIMLGLGGPGDSAAHAHHTATALTLMDPWRVTAAVTRGRFPLPDRVGLLRELYVILQEAHFTACRFSSNVAGPLLPVRLHLPADRDRALRVLASALRQDVLAVLDSPCRQPIPPVLAYITQISDEHPDRTIAVIVPELAESRWYHYCLHNQRAVWLKAALLLYGQSGVVVINVPWYADNLPAPVRPAPASLPVPEETSSPVP